MGQEVESYKLKNFEYRTPYVSIDKNGEAKVQYLNESPIHVGEVTFIFEVERDEESSEIIKARGIDVANAYLMHLALNKGNKDTSVDTRAFLQYFTFLNTIGMNWDEMPIRKNRRPTYRFKKHLEDLYRDLKVEDKLSVSTSKAYMRRIIAFYRHKIVKGYPFANDPFESEIVSISTPNKGSHMQATRKIGVHSADIRLKIANKKEDIPSKLMAMSKSDWNELDHLIRKERKIIKNVNGVEMIRRLAIEFSLMFLLMRYVGLRRIEALTFNTSLIYKPTTEELKGGYIKLKISPIVGVKTKNDKEREIEIPARLMSQLYEYMQSSRYIERRVKFERADSDYIPIFLNNRGLPYSSGSVNARWSEIRKTLERKLGRSFEHKVHNLRPTYAVFRLLTLIKAGVDSDDALNFIQNKLGHSNLSTTTQYLKQVKEKASGDQKAEIVYDFMFNMEEFEF